MKQLRAMIRNIHAATGHPLLLTQATTTPAELYEQIQEQIEAADRRDAQRRAESRAMRRFIAEQPKRLVDLDAVIAPGVPSWEDRHTVFINGLPREWVCGSWVNRLEARRS